MLDPGAPEPAPRPSQSLGDAASAMGDFVLDFARTWLLLVGAPWRAGAELLADRHDPEPRYAAPTPFLLVAAMLFALVAGQLLEGLDDLPSLAGDLAENAVKLTELDEDVFGVFVLAAATTVWLRLAAELASRLAPRPRRQQASAVFSWVLSGLLLSVVACALLLALGESMGEGWGVAIATAPAAWAMGVAPVVGAAAWVRGESGLGRPAWNAAVAAPFALLVLASFAASLVALAEVGQRFALSHARIAATQAPQLRPDGSATVTLEAFLDAGEVLELCEPALCPEGGFERPVRYPGDAVPGAREQHEARLADAGCVPAVFDRGWLPPREPTELRLVLPSGIPPGWPGALRDPVLLCCWESPGRCFSDFRWGAWEVATGG